MLQEINVEQFRDAFRAMNRGDTFSHEALGELYGFLEENESYKLDVIDICCEFSEEKPSEVIKNYGLDELDDLNYETWWVQLDNGNVLYQVY